MKYQHGKNDRFKNVDKLHYHTYAGTNRLSYVSDAVTAGTYTGIDIDDQASANYTYSRVGNLLTDANGGITSITWNPYGKPVNVYKNTGKRVTFIYDPFGRKVLKYNQTTQVTEYYALDPSGNILAIYQFKSGGIGKILSLEQNPIYGVDRIGTTLKSINLSTQNGTCTNIVTYPLPSTNIFQSVQCEKQYELSNHLGNVMVTFRNQKICTGSVSSQRWYADVVSASDYYPFGMLEPGRNSFASGKEYKFGFNGEMKVNDIYIESGSFEDYGMRMYDTRICRFISVDPLKMNYPELTTYQFASNTPIGARDLDGLEAQYSTSGRFISWIGDDHSETAPVIVDGKTISLNLGQLIDRAHWIYGEGRGNYADWYAWAIQNLKDMMSYSEDEIYKHLYLDEKRKGKDYFFSGNTGNSPYDDFAKWRKDEQGNLTPDNINKSRGAKSAMSQVIKQQLNISLDPSNGNANQWLSDSPNSTRHAERAIRISGENTTFILHDPITERKHIFYDVQNKNKSGNNTKQPRQRMTKDKPQNKGRNKPLIPSR